MQFKNKMRPEIEGALCDMKTLANRNIFPRKIIVLRKNDLSFWVGFFFF